MRHIRRSLAVARSPTTTVLTAISEEDGCPSVVGTGLIALDIVYGLDQQCAPNLFAGGTCGNVLAALAFLGWQAFPVARLNGDAAGERVRSDLARWNVRLDFARLSPQARTPVVVQRLRLDGEGRVVHRFSAVCPHCGAWLPQYVAVPKHAMPVVLETIATPEVVFIDRVSPGAVALAEAAYERGALVYFEPSARCARPLFERVLAVTHIMKYSQDRAHHFRAFRPRHSVVPLEIETRGAAGVRYRGTLHGAQSRAWRTLPAFEVSQLRDAAGAGDWFTAGVIHAIGQAGVPGFEGLPRDVIEEGLRIGQAFAAWACAHEGPRGGMYRTAVSEVLAGVEQILVRGRLGDEQTTGACDPPFDVFAEVCETCTTAASRGA